MRRLAAAGFAQLRPTTWGMLQQLRCGGCLGARRTWSKTASPRPSLQPAVFAASLYHQHVQARLASHHGLGRRCWCCWKCSLGIARQDAGCKCEDARQQAVFANCQILQRNQGAGQIEYFDWNHDSKEQHHPAKVDSWGCRVPPPDSLASASSKRMFESQRCFRGYGHPGHLVLIYHVWPSLQLRSLKDAARGRAIGSSLGCAARRFWGSTLANETKGAFDAALGWESAQPRWDLDVSRWGLRRLRCPFHAVAWRHRHSQSGRRKFAPKVLLPTRPPHCSRHRKMRLQRSCFSFFVRSRLIFFGRLPSGILLAAERDSCFASPCPACVKFRVIRETLPSYKEIGILESWQLPTIAFLSRSCISTHIPSTQW